MPIDERLRVGLDRNTEHLVPDLDLALATTYGRARGRQRLRLGVIALATAAAIAVTAGVVTRPGSVDVRPARPNPTPAAPSDLLGVRGAVDPGAYSIAVWGQPEEDLPRVLVDVPEGYFSNGGFVIDAGHSAQDPEDFGVVQVYRVEEVLADPCDRTTAADPGPTVADLARALVDQSGPSTRPRGATLDGHTGSYLQVTVPPETDLRTCSHGEYSLWRAGPREFHGHSDPGVVHHLWILEVDGTRLVVVASIYPDQPASQDQELIDMAESIRFVAPD